MFHIIYTNRPEFFNVYHKEKMKIIEYFYINIG